MTCKTLLVAVDVGEDSDVRVRLACDLAAGLDAHLIGVCGVGVSAPVTDDLWTAGAMVGEAMTLFRDLADAEIRSAMARFHELVGGRRERSEGRGRLALPADLVVREARATDLVILGRRSAKSPGHAADPADVLMAVGRPVLVVPPRPTRDLFERPAVIAWKDSREAQRAAAAALPLLRHVSVVHVVEFWDGDGDPAAPEARTADVVAWLRRHGLEAEGHVQSAAGVTAGQAILTFAEDQGAGLVVAGAYGHARLREWALGGVTHELLTQAAVCVLLSH